MTGFVQGKGKWLLLCSGLLCLFLALGLLVSFKGKFGVDTARSNAAEIGSEFERPRSATAPELETWVVYITGAVVRPGVYEVPEDSRINDAVRKAGGFAIHANPEAINLAAKLSDGAHIRVPSQEDNKNAASSANHLSSGAVDSSSSGMYLQSSQKGPEKNISASQSALRININTCTENELCALPGIGPMLSQTIINHREANGPFESVDELTHISGIGPKRLDAIRELIAISND